MNSSHKFGLIAGMILFILGIGFGLIFNFLPVLSNIQGMSLWGFPDLIAFDPSLENDGVIDYIKCPLLVTPGDKKEIQVSIRNKEAKEIKQNLLFIASDADLELDNLHAQEKLVLKPNEVVTVSRSLFIKDNVNTHLLAIRVFLFQDKYPIASFTRHCGILFYQVGNLHGDQVISLAVGLFVILTGTGIILWWLNSHSYRKRSSRLLNRLFWISGSLGMGLAIHLTRLQFLAIVWLILSILILLSIFEESLMGKIFSPDNKET
jgi:hypothetical protein